MHHLLSKKSRFYHYLVLGLLFITGPVNAQEKLGTVAGKVVDENYAELPFVQVILKRAADSSSFKTMLADDKGHFSFEIPAGKYLIELRLMGYGSAFSKTFDIVAGKTVLLDAIQLRPVATQLAAVNISAPTPFVERRADKLIVNLNGLGAGAPIMEVMNQLPGVSVTPDDRISLNGKSVQIYIDGKTATLSPEALAGMLKGISSSAIQKVELIAQPSAK